MLPEQIAYPDNSTLTQCYLNESGWFVFVSFLKSPAAVISSLTLTEIRALLNRRRRMGHLTTELELLLFAVILKDIDRGWLQRYPVDDVCFTEESNLIARHPDKQLPILNAMRLTLAAMAVIPMIATADAVMAEKAGLTVLAVERL